MDGPNGKCTYGKLYIGGEWRDPHSPDLIELVDPSTEQVWATVPDANTQDVDDAVLEARQALDGPWKSMTGSERGRRLRSLASLIRDHSSRLAKIETRDNGKPIRDTTREVNRSADWFDYYAGAADKLHGETIPFRNNSLAYTLLEPVGVVAAITPWNSPISMYSWKLAPALATGNAVIIKPSEITSASAFELAKLCNQAELPPGVVNVVTGRGPGAGRQLALHPGVNKIAFTGEHTTAQSIMADASANLKRVSFECGGKAPHIIFADANLDHALVSALNAAFRATGQSCSIGSRLLLEKSIYDSFISKLVDRVGKIRIGPPLDDTTHIGPHTSKQQLHKTLSYIRLGKAEGAKLLIGGSRPSHMQRGYYVEPTVFGHVDNDTRLAQEEIFGPVLSVIPFEDEAEALRIANNTKYGLVAAVWTSSVARAHRVVNEVDAGFISVNTYRPVHYALPYGGYKLSGLGRENGLEVLREYTELKCAVIDSSEDRPTDMFQ